MLSLATNGRKLCGRYTLLEKLGAGGQGEVWRARDDARGGEVAVKILQPALANNEAAWAALEREYQIAGGLDHPSILKVDPPLRDNEAAILPMELAAGGDLRRLRGMSYLEIVPVLVEVAQALEHAHEHGVIHRDLKPSNVLFDANGRAKLADFGIASGAAAAGGRDATGTGLSPFTASPEQLRGEPPAVSDDIYGLGALAYELLSGYPPYYPRFELKRVLEEPVPELKPVHQVPPRLVHLISCMLAKRPQQRPRTMRDVIDELDATLNDTLTFAADELIDLPSSSATQVASAVRQELPIEPTAEPPARKPAAADSARRSSAAQQAMDAARKNIPVGQSLESVRRSASNEDSSRRPDSARAAAAAAIPVRNEPAARVTAARGPTTARQQAPSPASQARTEPRTTPQQPQGPQIRTDLFADASDAGEIKGDVRIPPLPKVKRFEPVRPKRWPWVALVMLGGAAAGVFYFLPRFVPPVAPSGVTEPGVTEPGVTEPEVTAATEPTGVPAGPVEAAPNSESTAGIEAAKARVEAIEQLQKARERFDQQLADLESRAAGVWGGREFADAKARSAESVGAFDAGNPQLAEERLTEALRLLGTVESKAPQALAAQLQTGDRALEAGDAAAARQAFELAKKMDPRNQRADEGLQRAQRLDGVLPLLASAANAESSRNYSRAVQDYNKALVLDPQNARARAGLSRANAALGEDTYSKSVGTGYSALAAGRLEDARAAFEKARDLRPNGAEARTGLEQVNLALRTRGFASVRTRAAALEAEERWSEALQEYEAALKIDPSLDFAQTGKARAQARQNLGDRLELLINDPQRLASAAVRAEADNLLDVATSQNPIGPVLRSQITRLKILLPEFDKPVRLALESDNSTQIAIPRIGSFGTFSRREIELKPGKYTVIGTRVGYRDVRRDVTIAPGQGTQTISVRCVEPI